MHLSFEFFPPQTDAGLEKLLQVAKRLEQYNPEYFSVTFGAGGSTRERTLNTVKQLMQQTKIAICPHLSCVASTRQDLQSLLDEYATMGIKNIIALRGDAPSGAGTTGSEFTHASDLVCWMRKTYNKEFKIHVAAYPEVHPETESLEKELEHFKYKCAQGADSAITQYFFNCDAYTNFVERSKATRVPIIPGIMPIKNLDAIVRFSKMCGAELPKWLEKSLHDIKDDPQQTANFVAAYTTQLCRDLLNKGAPGLHFYTLNQADLSCRILDAINCSASVG